MIGRGVKGRVVGTSARSARSTPFNTGILRIEDDRRPITVPGPSALGDHHLWIGLRIV